MAVHSWHRSVHLLHWFLLTAQRLQAHCLLLMQQQRLLAHLAVALDLQVRQQRYDLRCVNCSKAVLESCGY